MFVKDRATTVIYINYWCKRPQKIADIQKCEINWTGFTGVISAMNSDSSLASGKCGQILIA